MNIHDTDTGDNGSEKERRGIQSIEAGGQLLLALVVPARDR